MVALYRNVLLDLDVVDALENRESVPNTRHPHLLQIVMLQCYKCLADNLVFCSSQCQLELSSRGQGGYLGIDLHIVAALNYSRNPRTLLPSILL